MTIKVQHISYSDLEGGACRAGYRIHQALHANKSESDVLSSMLVCKKLSHDPTVIQSPLSAQYSFLRQIKSRIGATDRNKFTTSNPVKHSTADGPTALGVDIKRLEYSNADIYNLHWLGDSTLSIEEIGRLKQPIIWTLHDQWVFCGAEHYSMPKLSDSNLKLTPRYCKGYTEINRETAESGPDINCLTWRRKKKSWKKRFHIVCPSKWMYDCAQNSALLRDWDTHLIPYAINLEEWAPLDKQLARKILGLNPDCCIILFGADGGTRDPRKGFDILIEALSILPDCNNISFGRSIELAVFGQSDPTEPLGIRFKTTFLGTYTDSMLIRLAYAAADVFVIPSRQDNLPNTGIEALSVGTPVVAFNTCGLPDIVDDFVNGRLAKPFDPKSLAHCIEWILSDSHRHSRLCEAARSHSVQKWHPSIISGKYQDLYHSVCRSQRSYA